MYVAFYLYVALYTVSILPWPKILYNYGFVIYSSSYLLGVRIEPKAKHILNYISDVLFHTQRNFFF